MLSVKNVSFSYNKEPFLEDISFDVKDGEFVSILGSNGSGKSTLISILSGNLKQKNGSITYNDRDLNKIKVNDRARFMACIYQNSQCAFPFTCYEIAEMGLFPHKERASKEDRENILYIMEETETIEFRDKLITELSGGEMQRVILARALVQRPKLLLLDEAMSGFDIAMRIKMQMLLKQKVNEDNMSVIFVRHDTDAAFSGSDRIIALKQGRILYNDSPKNLLNEKFFDDIFSVRAEITNDRFYIHHT